MLFPDTNRVIRLRSRPEGPLVDTDVELVDEPVHPLEPGQALVRNLVLSVEAANRIWLGHLRSFMPPVPMNGVIRSIGVGQVVSSRRDDMRPGDVVAGFVGWQDYCIADDALLEAPLTVLPKPLPAPVNAFAGLLGHTAVSAYLGVEFLDPQPGQTVVVSAAGGGVGSLAGQLAKLRGARVVGIAGGKDKCRHVVETLGFDVCVDHRDPRWREALDAATPDGIDLDFENVGGPIMDHILMRLNTNARIFLCGMASQYNDSGQRSNWKGLVNIDQVHMQRATVQGFIVTDHLHRWPEVIDRIAELWSTGKLLYDETSFEGLESAPSVLNDLMAGATRGKVVLHVADALDAGELETHISVSG
ncbi:MAG: NADP-dependent oxidoreductase [Rhodococcus sp. (in: high G+C Gram-positive bacteria)]